jgi:hypothetical protein
MGPVLVNRTQGMGCTKIQFAGRLKRERNSRSIGTKLMGVSSQNFHFMMLRVEGAKAQMLVTKRRLNFLTSLCGLTRKT